MALDKAHLGCSIANLRKVRGLTQRDLAERTGLTVRHLSLIENGERGVPPEVLSRLSAALHVHLDWIVEWFRDVRRPGEDAQVAQLIELTRKAMRATLARRAHGAVTDDKQPPDRR